MIRALALCDDMISATSFLDSFPNSKKNRVRVSILICYKKLSLINLIRFLKHLTISFYKKPWTLLLGLIHGRLIIRFSTCNSEKVINWVRLKNYDVGFHDASIIYRKPIIEAFRLGILNPHIGILPRFRGRSVLEWSILEERPTGITTFFIDEGIDTGRDIIYREFVSLDRINDVDSGKRFLFDKKFDQFRKACDCLLNGSYPLCEQAKTEGTRYYQVSGLLKEAAQKILQETNP